MARNNLKPISFVLGQILSDLAEQDVLTTAPREGTGRVIVKNNEFVRAVMAFDGYHLNDPSKPWFDPSEPGWEVLANDPTKPVNYYDDRSWMLKEFGLYWVGLPGMRQVRHYPFKWSELSSDAQGQPKAWPRDEVTKDWYANDFPYVIVETDAKTSEGLPIKLTYLLTVRITNPRKALFEAQEWLAQVRGATNRVARNFAGSFTYEQLLSETNEQDRHQQQRENFSLPIKALTNKLPDETGKATKGTKGTWGITINSADLLKVELTGDARAAHEEATITRFNADRKAEAKVIEATAEAEATRLTGAAKGDAEKSVRVGQAEGDERRLETYAKHPGIAPTLLIADAIRSPGDGKVVVIPAGLDQFAKLFAPKSTQP